MKNFLCYERNFQHADEARLVRADSARDGRKPKPCYALVGHPETCTANIYVTKTGAAPRMQPKFGRGRLGTLPRTT